MRIIAGQVFLELLTFYRTCYLGGRYGSGKTLLAVALSGWLLSSGHVRQVVSNLPVAWASELNRGDMRDLCIVLDESWLYLQRRAAVARYAGFLRKFNHYLLLPSVFPVHRLLSFFAVRRLYNLYPFGLPVWIYQWRIASMPGIPPDKGYFVVYDPVSLYGYYDTAYVPSDDGGIADALMSLGPGDVYGDDGVEDSIDAASVVSDAVESLSDVVSTTSRRRRR
jgi:hypothetical protein